MEEAEKEHAALDIVAPAVGVCKTFITHVHVPVLKLKFIFVSRQPDEWASYAHWHRLLHPKIHQEFFKLYRSDPSTNEMLSTCDKSLII